MRQQTLTVIQSLYSTLEAVVMPPPPPPPPPLSLSLFDELRGVEPQVERANFESLTKGILNFKCQERGENVTAPSFPWRHFNERKEIQWNRRRWWYRRRWNEKAGNFFSFFLFFFSSAAFDCAEKTGQAVCFFFILLRASRLFLVAINRRRDAGRRSWHSFLFFFSFMGSRQTRLD